MRIRLAKRQHCERLGEIIVNATRSAFEGRVPEHCLLELPVPVSVANWRRAFDSGAFTEGDQVLLVAEDTPDGVVAFGLAGGRTDAVFSDAALAATYPREIASLHVAPRWQHQGVGRSLVQAVADWLIASCETTTLAVRVLEPNPNRAFYVCLGASQIGSQPYDWDGFGTNEIIYGWQDISVISSAV